MPFISPTDMHSHIPAAIITKIAQGNPTALQDSIDAAIVEAQGYLSRYDINQLFGNSQNVFQWKPDPALLNAVKNIAKWHFINISNATIDNEDAATRYEQAVQWLSKIQSGKVVPPGWPPATPQEKSTFFHIKSNPKRKNHY